MRKYISLACAVLLAITLFSCADKNKSSESTDKSLSSESKQSSSESIVVSAPDDAVYIFEDNSPVFSLENHFYNNSISVELLTPSEAEIRFTLDGSEPDAQSELYSEPIVIEKEKTDFPTAHTIKAVAFYADGSQSKISAHTYFVSKNADERFSTAVFCISGDPAVLTEKPDGIFVGENYELRGDDSEREVYLEAFGETGEQILSQYCGIRIYGGVSREGSIKSMKLFARKKYRSEDGKFRADLFSTEIAGAQGQTIDKYDKLVLRNSGNDFQFAYIRDEMCQMLARDAGFSDYEAVKPAVVYLNGEYYGLLWLHESYCDDYFKEKYPDETKTGEFTVIEGTEKEKNPDDDEAKEIVTDEYNAKYEELSSLDMTDDANYAELQKFMDVYNYLDYSAFNTYICNKDWPHNNYRCYRYYPSAGEEPGEGVYDGRWRFLLHDTDYSFGLYEQEEVMADYDNLNEFLNSSSERYMPMLAALMKRDDCREYFAKKIIYFGVNALSADSVAAMLNKMNGERYFEQNHYIDYLCGLRESGSYDIWTWPGHFDEYTKIINDFAKTRYKHMKGFVTENLGVSDEFITEAENEFLAAPEGEDVE